VTATESSSGQGLPKRERLLKRREFLAIQRSGKRHHDRLFVLIWTPGRETWTRLGITTSRKVGNAVRRNRAKRLVREAFRRNKAVLPAGIDLVVIAKPTLPDATYSDVESALLGFAKKV
jgi:ribonuclease P protein component